MRILNRCYSHFIQVLSCSGLPKMDAYSDSDPMVYVVCGSSAFVTDVIDDKLDAYWLVH